MTRRDVGVFFRRQSPFSQFADPLRFAARDIGLGAGFLGTGPGRFHIALGQPQLRLEIVIPQPQQELPLLHPVAFGHGQRGYLATDRRRQLCPTAGLDGSGPGICNGFANDALRHFGDYHADRPRPQCVENDARQTEQDHQDDDPFRGATQHCDSPAQLTGAGSGPGKTTALSKPD